jgi:hypothetical protein
MSPWAIRPTFRSVIPCSTSEAISRFSEAMRPHDDASLYLNHGEYSEFHLEPHMHRLWSPHLSVYFADHDRKDQCWLIGRFAPRPNIWTLVWIFYLVFFCSIFFASIFGGSQWMIGQFPWGWAIVLATLILYAGLFLTSQIGQSLCHDQMELLRNRLDEVLQEARLLPVTTEETREMD